MTLLATLGWLLCGTLVGLCARFLVPGQRDLGLLTATVLGIVGALAGGFLYSITLGYAAEPFSMTTHNWFGWIVSILGAVLVLWSSSFFLEPERDR